MAGCRRSVSAQGNKTKKNPQLSSSTARRENRAHHLCAAMCRTRLCPVVEDELEASGIHSQVADQRPLPQSRCESRFAAVLPL